MTEQLHLHLLEWHFLSIHYRAHFWILHLLLLVMQIVSN